MNLKLINTFEREFGVPLSTIKKEKFNEIFFSRNLYLKYFSKEENALEILNYLKVNPELSEFSKNTSLMIELNNAERKIDEVFSRYTDDGKVELLIKSIQDLMSAGSSLECISMMLCSFIAFVDFDMSIYYNNVEKSFKDLFFRISELEVNTETYKTHCDVLDLLIQAQFYWNSNYDKIEIEGLDSHLKKLHDFEYNVLEGGKNASVDIAPEALNLIDITKLKK